MVAYQHIASLVTCDGTGAGAAEYDLALLGSGLAVQVDRGASVTHTYYEVAVYGCQRWVGGGSVGRCAEPAVRREVEQLAHRALVEAVGYLRRDSLLCGVNYLGLAVRSEEDHLSRIVVVGRRVQVALDTGVSAGNSRCTDGREVVGGEEIDHPFVIVDKAVDWRIYDGEGHQGGIRGLYPLAGNDYLPALAGGVGKDELVLIVETHHAERRIYLAVVGQLGLDTYLGHIHSGLVIRLLRVIVRDRDNETVGIRITYLKASQKKAVVRSVGEEGGDTGYGLTLNGRLHKLRFLAGCQEKAGQCRYYYALFHFNTSFWISSTR